MRPVSEQFLAALRGSHQAVTQVLAVTAGQNGVTPTGTELTVLSGDVQLDASADIRGNVQVEVDGTNAFPTSADDPLAPYGGEVFVRRGIAFGGGRTEYVSLGYFRINSCEQDEAPNGPIRIQGQDRMGGIVKARLTAPRQYAGSATCGDVVDDLVLDVYPWAVIEWDDATETTPIGRPTICEQDRFRFLADLVTGRGKIWYWDHRGVLVIKDPPDVDETVWEVDGGRNGVLIKLSRDLSDEGVYNAVVASGEAIDVLSAPTAVAYDDNPDSPTWWLGDFGQVPRFYTSGLITTKGQAQLIANLLLRSTLGVPYNVDFQAIVNPALEPWDPIAVRITGKRETHVLDRLTVPLTVEQSMTAQTREQTLVEIGEDL